jgi:hypothetical protein
MAWFGPNHGNRISSFAMVFFFSIDTMRAKDDDHREGDADCVRHRVNGGSAGTSMARSIEVRTAGHPAT